MLTPTNISARVVKAIADVLCIPEKDISQHHDLRNDLEADSLDQIEIAMELEEDLGKHCDFRLNFDDNYDRFTTVDELTKLVIERGRDLGFVGATSDVFLDKAEPLNFRRVIENRILEIVGNNEALHGQMRWSALVRHAFFKRYRRYPELKSDKKLCRQITLRDIIEMPDEDLFDTFEVVIRQFSKQF